MSNLLLVFFIYAGVLAAANGNDGKISARQKRGLFDNFIGLMYCKVDANDYSDFLQLSRLSGGAYGCYCGLNLGRKGQPQDPIDQCCKMHDDCWADAKENHSNHSKKRCYGSGWFRYCLPDECRPIWNHYRIDQGTDPCSCQNDNEPCEAALCKCDEDFYNCVKGVGIDKIQDPKPTCP